MEDKRGYKWLLLTVVVVAILTALLWDYDGRDVGAEEPSEEPSETTYNVHLSPIVARSEELDETKKEPEEDPSELGVFLVTAYCGCSECCDGYGVNRPLDENGEPIVYTAYGDVAVQGVTVAADPSVLCHGTQVRIFGEDYTVQDVGGDIKGNRLDVYFKDHDKAKEFGRRYAEVVLISEGSDK